MYDFKKLIYKTKKNSINSKYNKHKRFTVSCVRECSCFLRKYIPKY